MVECRDVRDDEEGFVKDRRHRRPEPGGGGRSEDADGCEHSSGTLNTDPERCIFEIQSDLAGSFSNSLDSHTVALKLLYV